jgi:hypothetical protein
MYIPVVKWHIHMVKSFQKFYQKNTATLSGSGKGGTISVADRQILNSPSVPSLSAVPWLKTNL